MKHMHLRKRTAAALLAVVMVAGMAGCGSKEPEQTTAPAEEEIVWVTAPAETQGIAVENAYMTFYYPQEWDGKVEESRSISGQTVTVTFQTDISGQKVVLFSVVMGPGVVDGYLLGQLEDPEEGTINVYSVMNEIDPEDWSEEEYNEICALQERVNDIIVQFYEDPRFAPSR